LKVVLDEVKKEASSHPTLAEKATQTKEPLLATLLLFSAKLGEYNFERILPAAVAVELIEMAVDEHFPTKLMKKPVQKGSKEAESKGEEAEESDKKAKEKEEKKVVEKGKEGSEEELPGEADFSENLSLITGDYYYSRAIMLVAGLRDVSVIRVLAEAVATIAEAMTFPLSSLGKADKAISSYVEWIAKATSLYDAAPHLGSYLTQVPEDLDLLLREMGRSFGGILFLGRYLKEAEEKIVEGLKEEYLSHLQKTLGKLAKLGFEVGEIELPGG
jgi:geranylgeranyl pyrophosphate synthase